MAGTIQGATNAVLTVTGANSSDEASYRCVVTTAYAASNSSAATLSLTTTPPATPVANSPSGCEFEPVHGQLEQCEWQRSAYRLDVSTTAALELPERISGCECGQRAELDHQRIEPGTTILLPGEGL